MLSLSFRLGNRFAISGCKVTARFLFRQIFPEKLLVFFPSPPNPLSPQRRMQIYGEFFVPPNFPGKIFLRFRRPSQFYFVWGCKFTTRF
jgi:hypothetical protein